MLTGHFRQETPDGFTLVSAESEAQRIYSERLNGPRILTVDEVNARSRMVSTILSERGAMPKLHKDRLHAIWQDMMLHAAAMQNKMAGFTNAS